MSQENRQRGRLGFCLAGLLLSLLLGPATGARAQIASGSYVGNGTAGRVINGLGFQPDVVIVKVDFDGTTDLNPPCSGLDDCSSAVIRISTMSDPNSKPLKGQQAYAGNGINALNANGFTVGDDLMVNGLNQCPASTSTPCTYYWVAFKANANIKVGTYTGNGGTLSIGGLGFSPEWVTTIPTALARPVMRFATDTNAYHWWAGSPDSPTITSLDANGFTVQNGGAAAEQNASGVVYHYVAINDSPGWNKVGTYTGDNTSPRSITGLGFQPSYVMVKGLNPASYDQVQRSVAMPSLESITFRGAMTSAALGNSGRGIRAFQSDGFAVGNQGQVNNLGTTYAYLALGACDPCAPLSVADAGSTITVTAPNSFEMVLGTAVGGGVQEFYDLAEDPGRTYDLAGGAGVDGRSLWSEYVAVGGTGYSTGSDGTGPRLDLLEATPTRVRVRQEAFFQDTGGPTVLAGPRVVRDLSIYPTGRAALRWNRRTTMSVTYTIHDQELWMHYRTTGPLSNWTAYSESGTTPNAGGTDDFLLERSDVSGVRTDFLHIMDRDWTVAQGHLVDADNVSLWVDAGFEVHNPWWHDANGTTMLPGAGPYSQQAGETWSYLSYFKPTNLGSGANPWLDPAVTSRRTDYRSPDVLSVATGSGWFDSSESTSSPSDFFNESEAAYTLDLDPAGGLTFDINGGVTRYSPFFKIRQWRSLQPPSTITLEGTPLTRDVHFKADVKPLARGYTAENLRWHCTIETAASCDAGSLDVGSTGSVANVTIVAARHGNGALINSTSDYVAAGTAVSGDFSDTGNWIEFWYQPSYNYNDGAEHALWSSQSGTNCFYFRKTSANALQLTIHKGGSSCTVGGTTYTATLPPATGYTWRGGDWVHLATAWGDGGPLRIFVDGTERVQGSLFNATGVTHDVVYFGGCGGGPCPSGTTTHANGILDEIHIYDYRLAQVGKGGLGDYLGDPSGGLNYQFTALGGVDASRRGNYLYFGADSKFRGLNAAFVAGGVGPSDGGMVWEYWNGGNWTSLELPGFVDETRAFKRSGTVYWTSDPPGWSLYSTGGGPELYYVRAHLASGESYSIPPTELVIKTDILLLQYCTNITAAAQTFVFAAPIPTAVELEGFSARGLDAAVELTWQTASELKNLGFQIYRAEAAEGPYERITPSVIPGLGSSPSGASYRYTDAGLLNGTTYFYELEDIETTGTTKLHGPVWATPLASPSGSPPEGQSASAVTFGYPSKSALSVVKTSAGEMTLELTTGGFVAEPQPDGSVKLSIPGFSNEAEPGSPDLPEKRSWVVIEAGRRVRIASVQAEDVKTFSSLRPTAADLPEVVATPRGAVRAGRRAQREGPRFREEGLYPQDWARLLEVGYQGDVKKALLEASPLRWNRSTGELVMAPRLVVRLVFSGREPVAHREGRAHLPRDVARRLITREKGLYSLSFEELFGLRGRGVSASSLRLSRLGEAVAFRIEPDDTLFAPGSRLYFLSEGASANPYGNEAVYELELSGGGTKMATSSLSATGLPVSSYFRTVSREENRYYQAGLLEAEDLWLWDLLLAPATKSYPFELNALASSAVPSRLDVWLQGVSDFPQSPDHHVRVSVNGSPIYDSTFEGKEPLRVTAEVAPGVLREGENEISIENVGDTGAPYSMVMLDRFEVSYPRMLVADEGELEGAFGESGVAEVEGFPGGSVVLDVTGSSPRWLGRGSRFAVEAGRRYRVVSPEAIWTPELVGVLRPRWKSPQNRADYLVVGPKALLDVAGPLLELRRSQGLRSVAVPIEEVYSEFGFGESRPEAVRELLSYAHHHWQKPSPRYVLLLGDATYDFKDHLQTGVRNRVPPLMVRTSYLWTASDPTYAAINGDDELPDLAIGRLPAASAEEAQVMVDKILAYEATGSLAQGPVVLVADNPDGAGNFQADADEIAEGVLASRHPRKIYLGQMGTELTRQAIVEAFDEGASLLSYVGHGGIHLWANENLFDTSRVPSLARQSERPFVLTLNCLNGYFQFPFFDSLSEALVKAPAKGALAAFSPAGLSLNEPARLFHEALLREVLSGRHERLGDAVSAAQASYAGSGAFPELVRIYHLFGDPALRLR